MALIFGSKTTIATGGISTTTVGTYTVHQFTTSANFTPATTGFVDVLLVGGGGGSGNYGPPVSQPEVPIHGGGGAGATLFKKMIPVIAGTPYPVVIGPGLSGNTTFTYSGITTTAYGGGKGAFGNGNPNNPGVSSPFASGGGGGANGGSGGTGAGILGIGYAGGSGNYSGYINGGGGGGAGGAGSPAPSTPNQSAAGGPGVPITYFTGVSPNIVSIGGSGGTNPGGTVSAYGSGGTTSLPTFNPGNPAPGQPGVAYIRYI